MAGKEAIVFLVDCNRSMAGHMELTRKAIRVLMVQKMLQSKQHELGVVLFGLPELETSNKLNDKDEGDYLGVKELCMLDKGSVDILRKVESIDVPDAGNGEEGKGDLLDAMVVGLHMIRSRTIKKKYARHVYLLTDAATPVEEASQLGDIVNMYADASMECKLHFVGLGVEAFSDAAIKQEEAGADGGAGEPSVVKEQNEKMLASVAAATSGTVVPAATLVNVMGESTIKTTNPVLSKVDLLVGTSLTLHCRFFKKTDTGLKESLKKESIASYDAGAERGSGDGKVRVDKTYRDPEMPEVEVDFENQVKGYRYGQDYIPVNTVDEDSLKLPTEPPSIKILGFVPSSTIARHLYMDDTFVLLPEPGSEQALGAVTSLTQAMRNLDQVAAVRFVRRKAADPWLGILIPDPTGSATQHRFLFQKIPCSEDIRDYTFPSFSKGPSSRKPSKEQKDVSASLVAAMTVEGTGAGIGGFREGLVLDPVRQGVNGAKVARAIDPDCELPELHPTVKAALSPEPELVERATPVWEEYQEAFYFEKQERAKAGKKRVTYFSDLTLAEPDTATAASAAAAAATAAADGSNEPSSKKARRPGSTVGPADGGGGAAGAADSKAASAATQQKKKKVGSINPVSDFEAMMASAANGDQGGAELAELAVEQMQNMIHTFIRKGTTASLRTKAVSCVKALRRACVSHSMGKKYNEFVRDMKGKYQRGDNSDVWEMVTKDQGTWPVTSEDDGSLSMTPQAAAELMKVEEVKQEEEEAGADEEDDDDVDDMD